MEHYELIRHVSRVRVGYLAHYGVGIVTAIVNTSDVTIYWSGIGVQTCAWSVVLSGGKIFLLDHNNTEVLS